MKLKIFDTLSGKKREFNPLKKGFATIYVCGITPYSYSHIGHARSYINFDILVRVLKFLGLKTNYIRNFTDIDDKLLKSAEIELKEKNLYPKLAEKYIKDFSEQMEQLNNLKPDIEPKATETVNEMINFIESLIKKDFAYKLGDDVYFDISKAKNYGSLSKKNVSELLEGSRVESVSGKKNSGDFVLWKGNSNAEFWEAPFGYGRPGWHIECSAMIKKHSNGTLDFHGGGFDLIFPHHENEIAQSEAENNYPLANFWIHNSFINIDSEKMSKSLGNSIFIKDIFKKVSPEVFRFYILQHSFNMPINFSFSQLEEAVKPFKKLCSILKDGEEVLVLSDDTDQNFLDFINPIFDNLNISKTIGLVFKNADKIKNNKILKNKLFSFFKNFLGFKFKIKEKEQDLSPEVLDLIEKREEARKNKDWKTADKIRDKLKNLGIKSSDKPIK